tara:strand:- start:301 stop:537 length:237 start_codon:yes stop_codon:yes gene_type:complete
MVINVFDDIRPIEFLFLCIIVPAFSGVAQPEQESNSGITSEQNILFIDINKPPIKINIKPSYNPPIKISELFIFEHID